jgi:hypothetical protein
MGSEAHFRQALESFDLLAVVYSLPNRMMG